MALKWCTPVPGPPAWTHLPVDALVHLTLPLLEGLSYAPLFLAHPLPSKEGLPPIDMMTATYGGPKGRSRCLLLENWKCLVPPRITTHSPSGCLPTPLWASESSWPAASTR